MSALGFVIALVLAALIVFPLAGPLRRHPVPFYLVALVATAAYAAAVWTSADLTGVRWISVVFQKGYLTSILLGVVMFTGVINEGTPLRKHLQPIRGELSILSFILILGHLATYLPAYLPRLGVLLGSHTNVALSLVVAFVLTALFLVLALTSIRVIRKKMAPRAWKNLQRLSYLMIALLAVHVGLVLGRSAFAGGAVLASVAFWAYIVLIAVYAILRVRKALHDRTVNPAVQPAV